MLLVQGSKSNTINTVVLGLTFLITIFAGVYVYMKLRNTKKILLAEQAARQDSKRLSSPSTTGQPDDTFWRTTTNDGDARPQTQGSLYEMNDIRKPVHARGFV